MTVLTSAVGGLLVVLVLFDLFTTAVSVGHGAGPLSGRLAHGVWRALLRLRRHTGPSRLLVLGGPLILLVVITVWVLLLILGWSLVFGAPETLLRIQDGSPVPALGRMRYAATLVIGRGSSGVQPSGAFHEVVEPVAALTGLTVLSLSIAYVLPVVQGVVAKRSLALYLSTLGHSPDEILVRSWNGTTLGQLDLHLIALAPRIAEVAQSHLAYPIIHFFHSDRRATALGPAIVALDRALTAHSMISREVAIDDTAITPLRITIDRFLDTLRLAFVEPAEAEVGQGDDRMERTRRRLEDAGIPLDPEARTEVSEDEVRRNRLLRGYLRHDGWVGEDEVLASEQNPLTAATRDGDDTDAAAPLESDREPEGDREPDPGEPTAP